MLKKGLIVLFFVFLFAFLIVKIIPKLKGKETLELGFEEETKKVSKKEKKEILKPPVVDLSMLQKGLEEKSFSIGRNIFRYGVPKRTETTTAEPGREGGRNAQRVPPKVVPEPLTFQEQPQPPRIETPQKKEPPYFNYRYLGFFGPQDKKLAVFSDGKEIIDVFEGETIMDKFILKKIGYESVTIGFVGFPEDITQKIEVGP